MPDLQQNSGTNKAIEILCTLGSSVVSGNTPTITLRKNGGTGAAATGTVAASDTFGVAYYTPSSADVNTLGPLTIEVSGTGIDSYAILGWTVRVDNPYTRFPAAAAGANGGLPTLSALGLVDANVAAWGGLTQASGAAKLNVDDNGYPSINVFDWLGATPPAFPANFPTLVIDILGNVRAVDNSGNPLATAAAVANIQNNTFVASNIPTILERPDSGSEAVLLTLTFADETGTARDIDAGALPTVTLVDNASTSLAARLSAWTHAATGKYTASYTNSASDALENIHWEVTATVNTKLRRYVVTTQLVDTTAVDFTSTDRTNLGTILAQSNKLTFDGSNNVHSTPQTGVTVTANNDKTGYTLTGAEHANIASDVQSGLTSQGYTSARGGYLDNLNVGGAVASHSDVVAINQSASRTMTLATVGQYAPGESYTIEMNCFNRDTGSLQNADTTPTLAATGAVSGSLAANLTGPTSPSTGVYRWAYAVPATPALEQIRFDGSATVASFASTLSCYAQTVDEPSVVWTTTDQSHLAAIFNKLPTGNLGDATSANQTTLLTRLPQAVLFDGSGNVKTAPQTSVTVGTNNDKAGYALASNGLASVNPADPTGSPATWDFRAKLMWVFRRLARSTYDSNAGTMKTYDSTGAQISSQTATDSGGVQSTGELS